MKFFFGLLLAAIGCAEATAVQVYPEEWRKLLYTSEGNGVAPDNAGNVFVSGYAHNPGFQYDASLSKFDSNGIQLWKQRISTREADFASALASDSLGNAYVAGYTSGNLAGSNAGGYDAFVTKLDNSGNVLWSNQFGTRDGEFADGITVDRFGAIYVTGYTDPISIREHRRPFLTKIDNSGSLMWTRDFNSTVNTIGAAVATDSQGNVYVAGTTVAGSQLTKFDSDGQELWSKTFGHNMDFGNSVAVDRYDNVYLSGTQRREISKYETKIEAFLIKVDGLGQELWSKRRGAAGPVGASSIASDEFGNVFMTGYTTDDPLGYSQKLDVFLTMYDAAGNEKWTQQVGSSNLDHGISVAVGDHGNVFIAGRTEGDLVISKTSPAFAYGGFLMKFTYAVPEPGSAILMLIGSAFLLNRKRPSAMRRHLVK